MTSAATEPRDVRGDVRAEIREFLTTRRARITPEQAGLPVYGGDRRRVPGLRREEVALLAGISPRVLRPPRARQRHRRLRERHRRHRPRPAARRGRAGAPARPAPHRRHDPPAATSPPRPAARPAHRPAHPRLDAPARRPFVLNGRLDILAANALGRALFSPVYADPARPPNNARFVFLDPHATDVLPRLGQGRQRHRRPAARRGRPRPLRPGPLRPDRRAVHPQRGVPPPLGRPRRPHPHHRRQAPPPPRRRRPRPALRVLPPAPRTRATACSPTPPSPAPPTHDALALLASWAASGSDADQPAPAERSNAPGATQSPSDPA